MLSRHSRHLFLLLAFSGCMPFLLFANDTGAAFEDGGQITSETFHEAIELLSTAMNLHAEVLAPSTFGQAVRQYKQAKEDFKNGRDARNIYKILQNVVLDLERSIIIANEAAKFFDSTLRAREDVRKYEDIDSYYNIWEEAEAALLSATALYEKDLVTDAEIKAIDAEMLYWQIKREATQMLEIFDTAQGE